MAVRPVVVDPVREHAIPTQSPVVTRVLPARGSMIRMAPVLSFGVLVLFGAAGGIWPSAVQAANSTADHTQFDSLQGPFGNAKQVTEACLDCHTEAGKQVTDSIHWSWEFQHPVTGQKLGKRHVINSFCGNVASNEARCTSCHAGYGWEDTASFDFIDETGVDCLVCHDTTAEYIKWNDKAGYPLYEAKTQASRVQPYPDSLVQVEQDGKFTHLPPDLSKVAQSVGSPGLDNCGNCHFYGGGGDNVKHGDLSSALINATPEVDVHMSPDGAGLACIDCHAGDGHDWPGSRYLGAVEDTGEERPGFRNTEVLACDSCHTDTPHDSLNLVGMKLNDHTDTVACQSCHIPEFARGGPATKMWWDWSTAGKLRDGKPYAEHDEQNRHSYLSQKGDFRWEENVVPEYRFWNGVIDYTLLGDTIDATQVVSINHLQGSSDDPKSRIYPFKLMRGKQAYDSQNLHLLQSKLYGPDTDTAFWTNFSWEKALNAGMEGTDVSFSGEYDFVETEMWWPTTHMVAPAGDAVKCGGCHAQEGRLTTLAGFYLPGRDGFDWTDRIGAGLLLLTLLGVAGHALMRAVTARRRSAAKDNHEE